ncbi:MAG: GFA family protein [bacterium]|nr:GFA family protein [bacterium]
MNIDGGCHCGHVTFHAVVDPERVMICNCTDCQTLSGSPFRVVVRVSEDEFHLESGALKTYVKTGESGKKRAQRFCPECGTHIYATSAEATAEGEPRRFGIRVGTIRQRRDLVPKRQFWHRSAQPWLGELASIPTAETQ